MMIWMACNSEIDRKIDIERADKINRMTNLASAN